MSRRSAAGPGPCSRAHRAGDRGSASVVAAAGVAAVLLVLAGLADVGAAVLATARARSAADTAALAAAGRIAAGATLPAACRAAAEVADVGRAVLAGCTAGPGGTVTVSVRARPRGGPLLAGRVAVVEARAGPATLPRGRPAGDPG